MTKQPDSDSYYKFPRRVADNPIQNDAMGDKYYQKIKAQQEDFQVDKTLLESLTEEQF